MFVGRFFPRRYFAPRYFPRNGQAAAEQVGASPTGYIRREPMPEENEDEILMILITEILLNE